MLSELSALFLPYLLRRHLASRVCNTIEDTKGLWGKKKRKISRQISVYIYIYLKKPNFIYDQEEKEEKYFFLLFLFCFLHFPLDVKDTQIISSRP